MGEKHTILTDSVIDGAKLKQLNSGWTIVDIQGKPLTKTIPERKLGTMLSQAKTVHQLNKRLGVQDEPQVRLLVHIANNHPRAIKG